MKRALKLLTTSFIVFLFGLLSLGNTYASENTLVPKALSESKVEVIVIDDHTGVTQVLDSSDGVKFDIIKTSESLAELSDDFIIPLVDPIELFKNRTDLGYEVFIPIEGLEGIIKPFTVEGGTKTSGGVTAKLNVDYNWRESTGEIKVNRVYGSWTPSTNMYKVSNRNLLAHNGAAWGVKKLEKKPTSNTFSYTTGWGYNGTVTGAYGPMAESTAKIVVDGMSGTSHTIQLRVFFPS